jgi:hypothetical protein
LLRSIEEFAIIEDYAKNLLKENHTDDLYCTALAKNV